MDRTTFATPPRRLLGVWAHPDDERLPLGRPDGPRRRRRWLRHGRHRDPRRVRHARPGAPRLVRPSAPCREAELRASLAVLGVTDVRFLGLRDGGLAEEDDRDPGRGRRRASSTRSTPTVIVTFGPDGMTWHPDHQAVCAWTTRAAQATGRGDALLYATMTDDFADPPRRPPRPPRPLRRLGPGPPGHDPARPARARVRADRRASWCASDARSASTPARSRPSSPRFGEEATSSGCTRRPSGGPPPAELNQAALR